ncbi:MAG: hypothetical protein KME49_26520 [Brasilonema octagenarum HA4186-MV1]|jgi:hypothetical protein|nr:hypothetical protein [Brasilonema octagenarum HA4186-MV1]
MARKSIRQLANEHGINTNDLITALGAKSGGDLIDEEDPRIAQFLKSKRSSQQTAQQQAASQEGEISPDNLTTEVIGEYREHLTDTARTIRIQAGGFLRREVGRYHMMPTSEVLAELETNNQDTISFQDCLSQAWNPQSPFEQTVGWLPPQQRKALVGATSVPKSQTNSTQPLQSLLETPSLNSTTSETQP